MEAEAINIEAKLQQLPPGTEVDTLSLSAGLTACRTRLVTLHTEAETKHTQVERHFAERRKRIAEIKRYQTLLIDLEQWLGEAQATISTEIKLTSVTVVRDQIRASQVGSQDWFWTFHLYYHCLRVWNKISDTVRDNWNIC